MAKDTNTVVVTGPSGKKATFSITSENNKITEIGDINYSPALDTAAEVPVYAQAAQLLRKKLVD
jgi:hypothetical protein